MEKLQVMITYNGPTWIVTGATASRGTCHPNRVRLSPAVVTPYVVALEVDSTHTTAAGAFGTPSNCASVTETILDELS